MSLLLGSMQLMGRAGLTQTLTQAALDAVVMTVFAQKGEQLGTGAAGVANSRLAGQRNWWGLAGGQQAIMDVTQQVGGPIRQGHGHQQIRQVVMGHHQGRHRFVGIMPVGKLLAGKPQRLLIAVERPGVLPASKWRLPLRVCAFQCAMLLSAPVVPTHPSPRFPS